MMEIDQPSAIETILAQQEYSPEETQLLLDFAIANIESAAHAPHPGRMQLDVFGTGKRADQFAQVIGKLSDPQVNIPYGEDTAEKVSLLLLGIFHSERTFYLLEYDYCSAENLSHIVKSQLNSTEESDSKNRKFLKKIALKLRQPSPELINAEDLSSFAGPCIDELLDTASVDTIGVMSRVVYASEFGRNNPKTGIAFISKVNTLIDSAIQNNDAPTTSKLLKVINPSNLGNLLQSLGEKRVKDAAPTLKNIGKSLLPLISFDNAYTYPQFITNILEWESAYNWSLDEIGTQELFVQNTKMLAQFFSSDGLERVASEPSTSFSLINSCLGLTLNTLVRDYSPLRNSFAANSVSDFAKPEVINEWSNLASIMGISNACLALETKLQHAQSNTAPYSPYVNAKDSIKSLIEQSPDLCNIVKSLEIKEYAAAFLQPNELLKRAMQTIDGWMAYIEQGVGENAKPDDRKGAQFLLNRVYLLLFTSPEAEQSQSAIAIKSYIDEFAHHANSENGWRESIRHTITDSLAEAFLAPTLEQITAQIQISPENTTFTSTLSEVVQSVAPEKRNKLTNWLLSITKENGKKPSLQQTLAGIIQSPLMTSNERAEVLMTIADLKKSGEGIEQIKDMVLNQLIVRDRVIEQDIVKNGLPSNWKDILS